MGMYHSTYFAYGFQIPDTRSDVLEPALKDLPGDIRVGYLHAGDYDRDLTFLVTDGAAATVLLSADPSRLARLAIVVPPARMPFVPDMSRPHGSAAVVPARSAASS